MAVIAADRDVPFVAVPAGTRNHLARDLGLTSVDDAVAAVRAGTVTRMIRSLDGPLRLAADGETYDGPVELQMTKRPRALQVAVPA